MERSTKTALIAGGVITGIVGIAVAALHSSANKVETTTKNYNTPSYGAPKTESRPAKVWYCVDATSYDKNPYNDNRYTNNETEICPECGVKEALGTYLSHHRD